MRTIKALMRAESPLIHARGTEGNEVVIAREAVIAAGGVRQVPFVSGNAIRHRTVRSPGARWLVEALGLAGKLRMSQLNLLFHGGALTESSAREDMGRIGRVYTLFPLLHLCGCSLPDQILPGRMAAMRGTLLCRENAESISAWSEGEIDCSSLRSCEDMVEKYQYVRGTAKQTASDLRDRGEDAAIDDAISGSGQMIYSGECVVTGSIFAAEWRLLGDGDHDLGCLYHAIRSWQRDLGGTIGQMGNRGHGRLSVQLIGADVAALSAAADAYEAFVRDHASECAELLGEVCGGRRAR